MEEKGYFWLLSILVIILLVVIAFLVTMLLRQKKIIATLQGTNHNTILDELTTPLPKVSTKTKMNRRPQLERVTIGDTTEKQPIYKSSEDITASEDFYYDEVKTVYNEPTLFMEVQDENMLQTTGQPSESRTLKGTRMFLLFAYIIAGATLFISIFYLLAAYMAARG